MTSPVTVNRSGATQSSATLTLEDLIRAAYHLPAQELEQLQQAIHALRDANAVMPETEIGFRGQHSAEALESRPLNLRSQCGHYELKRINGCGPYQYLRWWSNGKHRSTYIGKVKP